MQSHLFTVIVPAYNRLQLLQKALQSVWYQQFIDYDVIVVDDGSSDGTWEYINGLQGRIKAVRQTNKGPGAARNAGADVATGRYLAFLDCDDLWFPWTLNTYARVLDEMDNPVWISGIHRDFQADEDLLGIEESRLSYVKYKDYLKASKERSWLGVPGTVIRRDAFLTIRFDENNANGEDNDLWLRLGVKAGFGYIVEPPVFAYRRHLSSRVARVDYNIQGAIRMLNNEKAGIYPGGSDREKERIAIIGKHLRPVALACARSGRYREALTLYFGMFAWNIADLRVRFLLAVPLMISLSLIKKAVER